MRIAMFMLGLIRSANSKFKTRRQQMQSVHPKQLRNILSLTISARLPVLISGSPGNGKTDIVRQATEDSGHQFIASHPVVEDPTDAKGIPWPDKNNGHANFLLGGTLARIIHSTSPVVWCMDDLGQATPAVQAANMQWILARECNGQRLPDHVVIVACTNRRTDRAGVFGILEPVKSRFASILNLEPTLDDWCEWAYVNEVSPEVIAFLRFRPDLLTKFEPSADMANSPCPRTWAHAAKLVKLKLPKEVELAAFSGAVGEGAAGEFVAFLRVFRDMPNPDVVLMNPDSSPIPKELNALYALTVALAARATPENFGAVTRYAIRLMENQKGEFGTLLVLDSCKRDPKLNHSPEITKLATGELGKLMLGT